MKLIAFLFWAAVMAILAVLLFIYIVFWFVTAVTSIRHISVRPIFAWFYAGWYFDRKKRDLYIFPLPMIGFVIEMRKGDGK